MFKEFNVEFQNVEMIGGADNLLENTKVTKVVMSGDNKMSSLDSTFKNCSELDNIQGELDLNDVSDIDNILEDTELVKRINLKNINNENISADNSFPNVEEISIGGDSYNKKAIQNVIASKEWTFDNIKYKDIVGDNIVTKEVDIVDDNKVTIQDTLEQKVKGIEIIGQTYENLVVGNGEVTLLDELTLESIDGSTKEFNPHIEQPVCVEVIEGETYQNLVNGKGEYKLTDIFSTTWTESNNSIDNPPSMIEIPEIWGNTIQDENDLNIIQSVGELYVDEEGNPILDEEGNEQYKLELISSDGGNQSNKTTILLPQPLMKFENSNISGRPVLIYDKLYKNLSTSTYFVDNHVIYKEFNGSEPWMLQDFHSSTDNRFVLHDVIPEYNSKVGETREIHPYCNRQMVRKNTIDGTSLSVWFLKSEFPTLASFKESLSKNPLKLWFSNGDVVLRKEIKQDISLETYSPKTYISTNSEVQPSQMTITNKRNVFLPLGLQANKDYTLQLDSVGKDDKPITVNLGGTETTIQPTNDTKKHHKVVVRTPVTLTTDKLELSGEGVTVNDVMLFEGGEDIIKQEVEYIEGIQSIGELQGDGTYKIDILSDNGNKIFDADTWVNSTLGNGTTLNSGFYKVLGSNMIEIIANDTRIPDRVNQIQLKPNTKYSMLCNDASLIIYIYFKLQGTGQISGRSKIDFTTDETGRIGFKIPNGVGKIVKIDILDEKGFNYSAWSTQSILLPQPLNKIGAIKDKFYWDDDKGHYCIEQNIDENLEVLDTPNIIDLPHLNKKYSLDTYMPTTYLECSNSPVQPSKLLLESDLTRYKPSTLETNTDYTVQFECKEKSNKKIKLNLGGSEKEVEAVIGLNHVSITTPNELSKDKLFLSGVGNKVDNVMVVKGEMNQYPEYFEGIANAGELQDDGSYRVGIKSNEGFNVSIISNNPLGKADKLYWNKTNNRYEIDRSGVIEIPIVEGDVIDLPRLYQSKDTVLAVESGNINPSNIKVEYLDID